MSSESLLKPKRIHVFVNGKSTGRIFFIHPKCRLSWPSIVNLIGDLLKPQHGPIEILRRTDGNPVNSYEELKDNGKYVACGNEPLIPLAEGYRTDSEMEVTRDLADVSSSEIMNAIGSKINYLTDTTQVNVITIYIFMNGRKTKPFKISLLKTELRHWDTVLSIVSKQMNSTMKRLYTIFGEELKDPTDIQHRGFYVALPDDTQFEDVSYLSIFSAKKQRKVRFKQMTQQTVSIFKEDPRQSKQECYDEKKLVATNEGLSKPFTGIQQETSIRSCEVINVNDPTYETPCIHVTIVQRPFSASRHTPGVPSTVCAVKPNARLVLEMLSDNDLCPIYQSCKSTQTNTIFCEAIPKGKCTIEVASKKFHIISDEDTIVLPCGTYFSSHRSMKKPCIFPIGNESSSLEDIANHIVGIVVDTSEYCVGRAIHGLEQSINEEKKKEVPQTAEMNSKNENLCGEMETTLNQSMQKQETEISTS